MSVLNEIIVGVREDLSQRRLPNNQIKEAALGAAPALPVRAELLRPGISLIAEIKRSSPSKGSLASIADPAELARQYQLGGASVVSVLTEQRRFGGSLADLTAVRAAITLPILRKDFMIDEYQFYEARAYGADLVLLIVAALSKAELAEFVILSKELGMAAIVEVHTEEELAIALEINAEIIGVNSRNLKTLVVDQSAFSLLIPQIPAGIICIAESGITSRVDVLFAGQTGAHAILVGEALVRGGDPISAMHALLNDE